MTLLRSTEYILKEVLSDEQIRCSIALGEYWLSIKEVLDILSKDKEFWEDIWLKHTLLEEICRTKFFEIYSEKDLILIIPLFYKVFYSTLIWIIEYNKLKKDLN